MNRTTAQYSVFLRVVLPSLFLLLIASVFFRDIALNPVTASLLFAACVATAWAFAVRRPVVCLGIAFCTLALLGPSALSFWLCIWLLFARLATLLWPGAEAPLEKRQQVVLLALSFLLLALAGSAIPMLAAALDPLLLQTFWQERGLSYLIAKLAEPPFTEALPTLRYVLHYALVIPLFWQLARWDSRQKITESVLQGLVWGGLLAALCLLLQYFEVHPLFSSTRSIFWQFSNRYSGSFSDPNAFGLFVGVALPLLFSAAWYRGASRTTKWRYLNVTTLSAGSLLVAVLWSGSRSFFLLLAFWLAAVLILPLWKKAPAMAVAAVGTVLALLVAIGHPVLNAWLVQSASPTLARLLTSLHWDAFGEVLDTRVVFWKMALSLWELAPFTGIGLGEFYHAQVFAAERLQLDLGEWRDNANSFYLQLLAEGGLVALVVFLLCILLLWRALCVRSTTEQVDHQAGESIDLVLARVAKLCLFAIACLLFLGPHLDFSEVRFLLVLCLLLGLAAKCSEQEISSVQRKATPLLVFAWIIIPLTYLVSFYTDAPPPRGFYALEKGDERAYRWTSKLAEFSFCAPASGGQRQISVQAPRPDLPVGLRLYRLSSDNQWQQVYAGRLETTEVKTIVISDAESLPDRLRLEVDRVWQPTAQASQGDSRLLGVQMIWQRGICERISRANRLRS